MRYFVLLVLLSEFLPSSNAESKESYRYFDYSVKVEGAVEQSPWLHASLLPGSELYGTSPGLPTVNISEIVGPAFAEAVLHLGTHNSTHGRLNMTLSQSGYRNITGIGIFQAPEDANAAKSTLFFKLSPVFNFSKPVFMRALVKIELLDAIYSSPQLYYVQIRNQELPLGAGRGQLMDSTVSSGVGVSKDDMLHAYLTGVKVFPTQNPSIFDTAEFNAYVVSNASSNDTKTLFFCISTSLFLVNITSADIYEGRANASGPLEVGLSKVIRFPSLNANQAFRGSVTLQSGQVDKILAAPQLYYVQLSSVSRTEGAVRSQLQLGNGQGTPQGQPPPQSPSPILPPLTQGGDSPFPPPPVKSHASMKPKCCILWLLLLYMVLT